MDSRVTFLEFLCRRLSITNRIGIKVLLSQVQTIVKYTHSCVYVQRWTEILSSQRTVQKLLHVCAKKYAFLWSFFTHFIIRVHKTKREQNGARHEHAALLGSLYALPFFHLDAWLIEYEATISYSIFGKNQTVQWNIGIKSLLGLNEVSKNLKASQVIVNLIVILDML